MALFSVDDLLAMLVAPSSSILDPLSHSILAHDEQPGHHEPRRVPRGHAEWVQGGQRQRRATPSPRRATLSTLTPVARRLPTDNPETVLYLRIMYGVAQLLSVAIYYYVMMKVGWLAVGCCGSSTRWSCARVAYASRL